MCARFKNTYDTGATNREFLGVPDEDVLRKAARGSLRGDEGSDVPLAEAEPDSFYPYIIAMVGSAIGYLKVYEDGEFALVEGLASGGRCAYGLASLLTGCKASMK